MSNYSPQSRKERKGDRKLRWVKRSEPIIVVLLGTLLFTQPIMLADLKLGILINFNVPILKEGIERIVKNL